MLAMRLRPCYTAHICGGKLPLNVTCKGLAMTVCKAGRGAGAMAAVRRNKATINQWLFVVLRTTVTDSPFTTLRVG